MTAIQKKIKLVRNAIPLSRVKGVGEMHLSLKLKEICVSNRLWPVVYDMGAIYMYDEETGLWREIARDDIRSWLSQFHACKTTYGTTRVKMTSGLTKGAAEMFRLDKDILYTGFFRSPREGIPFQNGVVTIEDGKFKLVEHNHNNRLLAVFPFEYEPNQVPRRFLQLLDDVFRPDKDKDDKIKALQEFTGAAMAGVGTTYQKCLVATGSGSNGKNTVFDVLSGIFPSEFVTSISPQQWGDQNYRAMLHASSLNLVPDMQDTKILSNSDFKPIVSGDPVVASHKHRDPFEFRCRAAHWFICNELPAVTDFSYGYRRRFLVLGFNRTFKPGNEGHKTKEEIVDAILKYERGAIGCWALEGYKRLVMRGKYTEPNSHDKAMNQWLSQSDPIADFISNSCDKTVDKGDTNHNLYVSYRDWAKMVGHKKVVPERDFTKRLDQLGVEKLLHGNELWRPLRLKIADPDKVPQCLLS